MEPRFNEPLFNEDLDIFLFNTRYHKLVSFEFSSCINKSCMYGILCPSDSKMEENPDVTKPRYSEHILQFLGSSLYRGSTVAEYPSSAYDVQLLTNWWPLLCVFEMSLKGILFTFWTTSRFLLKQLDYSLLISCMIVVIVVISFLCDSWLGRRPRVSRLEISSS